MEQIEIAVKPRVIVHATGAPFVETYITTKGIEDQYGIKEDEAFTLLAQNIVKAGEPYWEIDWEVMNAAYDPTTRDAWVLDPKSLGKPTGIGANINV